MFSATACLKPSKAGFVPSGRAPFSRTFNVSSKVFGLFKYRSTNFCPMTRGLASSKKTAAELRFDSLLAASSTRIRNPSSVNCSLNAPSLRMASTVLSKLALVADLIESTTRSAATRSSKPVGFPVAFLSQFNAALFFSIHLAAPDVSNLSPAPYVRNLSQRVSRISLMLASVAGVFSDTLRPRDLPPSTLIDSKGVGGSVAYLSKL